MASPSQARPQSQTQLAPDPAAEPLDEKRQRILAAARVVCARRGLDGTRMDEIAAEARVSKGTLYNYFDSKESLIVASIVDHYRASEARIGSELGADDTPRRLLQRLIEAMLELFPEIRAEMSVNFQAWGVAVQHEAARGNLFTTLRDHYATRTGEIRSLVAAGCAAGEFAHDVDAGRFADTFLSIYDGFVYRSAFDPESATPEQLGACLTALVEDTLRPTAEEIP